MSTFNFEEFERRLAERLDKIEDSLISSHSRIDKHHDYLKNIEDIASKMNDAFERLKDIKEALNMHESAIDKIKDILNDFEENGINNNNQQSAEKINYDVLVNKLTKANISIIENEVRFALKQKK